MRRPRKAKLTEDDVLLWRQVAAQITPLPGRALPPPPAEPPPAPDQSPAGDTASALPVPAAPPGKPARPPLAGVETRLRQRVARGVLPIDARLDLHGMRQDAAHRRLAAFLAEAQRRGHTLVLIITGKGRSDGPMDDTGFSRERGVLRRLVPLWLADPQARAVVVGFEEAALRHGGSGALYVRIRRARN